MAPDTKAQTKPAVQKLVISWRQRIIQAGAIVAKPWRQYRTRVFQGYLIAAIVAFAVLAVLAHTVAYFTFDLTITRAVQTFAPGWFDALMRLIGWFGFAPQVNLVILMIFLFLYFSGARWEAVMSFISGASISTIGFVIKVLVVRPRPSDDLVNVLVQLKDYSFPSGHVLFYTTFFGFLLYLNFVLLKPWVLRVGLMLVFGGMVGLVGLSRIYEGQHWASDVLAAYLLGTVWLALMVYVYNWGKTRFSIHQPIAKARRQGPPALRVKE